MAFAEQSGLKNGRADAELARFRDYWHAQPGAKGRKADWPATWRNWCRKAAETPSRPNVGHAAEPAWRTEQRERMQAFAPGVAARRPGPTVTVIEGGDDGTVRLVG